jgi:hypothetical protein
VGIMITSAIVECTVDTLCATLPHYATTSDQEARGRDRT